MMDFPVRIFRYDSDKQLQAIFAGQLDIETLPSEKKTFGVTSKRLMEPDGSARAESALAQHGDFHPGHEKPADAQPACGDCTPCHLCSAFALPAATPVLLQDAASVYLTRLTLQPDGYLPDQPKRPPLA